ncbi:pyridine nucleotide-disulfide oxidoreductase [Parazoarcus communis]|uniref:Pyridine nucleotide-disulfide oxidoreductase n=1 Tax=Parazoarcus communis TaxID=41977 RepID=A0A2U8H3I3_9RHOO|nr:bifunctional TVP38/TMEM64 family protein/FAD-dependent oxidoreductase [Parazoarcus communis]AWI80274.1 pyridine nucleotide-disulfide oxidoreductase [Parazoarcus communis]
MQARKLAVVAAVASAIALFFILDLGQYLNLQNLKEQQAAIEAFRDENVLLSVTIYFVIYVLMAALSLPGAALLTLAGGAVFGLLWGTVIVSFASTIGATLAFLMSRFLLRNWVEQRFGQRLQAIDAGVRREGAFYLFTLRLVPAFPFFLVNLLLGLTAMKTRTYYWVSQLGMLAGTIVYVNAGTQLGKLESLSGILSPGLLGSFVLLGIFPLIARKLLEVIRMNKVFANWTKPSRFDRNLVVIGGGSAGLVTSYIAAAVKAKVTLVEKHKLGGDCLNTGCVPSKALIRSAKFLSHVGRSQEFGIRSARAEVDFADVMERVQSVIKAIEPHDSAERYTGLGVDVVQGAAKIVSPWEVDITLEDGSTQRLTTRSIVIATGARPFVPPIPGIEQVSYLTSDNVWELRELPQRLIVLGGGPIGCELTQAFARLGASVTQVEMEARIMGREDPEVSDLVTERFRAEGVAVLTGHKAKEFLIENGEKILIAEHEGEDVRIPFDAVLVAVGRAANLKGFGLEELGIPTGRTVDTNAFLQTNYPNIYAAGDVAGPFQFTHTAAHQAWYAAVNALFDPLKKFKADYSVIPWATFVEPEVARVGLNEQDAKAQGIAFEVTTYGIDDLDRAIADGEAHGFIKVLTVPGKDRILGVTIVGEHAGDLIAEYVLAMKQGIGLNKILGTIHIYPTLAEANKYVAGNWKKAHAPQQLLAWVERFHAWRRG